MRKKILNYGLFLLVVGLGIGFAVRHSMRIAGMVGDMAGANREARVAAAKGLVEAEQFMDSVSGETVERRVAIVQALEDWGEPPAVKQLVAYQKDPDKLVRDRILLALTAVGSQSGDHLQMLVNGLQDGDGNVRAGSVRALQILAETDKAKAELKLSQGSPSSSLDQVRDAVSKRKTEIGAEVVKRIVASLKAVDPARGPVGDVFGGLQSRADASVEALLPLLEEKDEKVRGAAITALGKLGDLRAVSPVAAKMKNDTAQIRRIAIIALAAIRKPECEPYLIEALQTENDDNEARVQATVSLGSIRTAPAAAALIRALADYDLKVQVAAVASISLHGDPAVPGLAAAIRNGETSVRKNAAQALGNIGTPAADQQLRALLQDSEAVVRVAAARGLGRANNSQAVAWLSPLLRLPDGFTAAAASEALAKIGAPARQTLVAALSDEGPPAYYASEALSRTGAEGTKAIEAARTSNSRGPTWIARTLGKIGGPDAERQLRTMASSNNPETQKAARRALARLGAE